MKTSALIQLAFVVLACTAVYAFVSMARDSETRRACIPVCAMRPSYAARNRLAPDFELEDTAGGKVKLSQFRGKTVVLNFWTTTCQPCLEEMPSIAELAKVLRHRKGTVVLTISTDPNKDVALSTIKTVLREAPPFQVLMDPEADVVRDKYGTHLFPETWIVDPQGVIRARFDGARDWSNAIVLDLIDSFVRPASCGIEFESGNPMGPEAAICDDSAGAG
jgi:peroxiredoxin